MNTVKQAFAGAVSMLAAFGLVAVASADSVKIGFVTTLTTPAGVIGKDMVDAVNLAVEDIGGKIGDLDVELIIEDDGFKPEIGKQKTDKLVKQDDVDFVAGFIWSHVLLASRKSALDGGKFLISSNAGPSQLAGELCHENFFSTSWQNDQTPMAMGEVLNQQGVNSLYIMAPNYAAGKNMVAGVERTFKGEVLGKDMTKWGKDAQLDFSAELAKAKSSGAEGIFVFYPGKAGACVHQAIPAGRPARPDPPVLGVHGRLHRAAQVAGGQHGRCARFAHDPVLGTGPGHAAEQEIRVRIQEEIRAISVVLRRAVL